MDKLALVKALFAAYPMAKPAEETYQIYLLVLKDIPLEELQAVVLQHVSTPGAFPPSAGDLRELWRKSKGMLEPIDGAQACIESIRRAVREVGYLEVPKFKDPLTRRVVETWGWRKICEIQVDDEGTAYAQMRQMYLSLANRAQEE